MVPRLAHDLPAADAIDGSVFLENAEGDVAGAMAQEKIEVTEEHPKFRRVVTAGTGPGAKHDDKREPGRLPDFEERPQGRGKPAQSKGGVSLQSVRAARESSTARSATSSTCSSPSA
jgi:hypothetical protein